MLYLRERREGGVGVKSKKKREDEMARATNDTSNASGNENRLSRATRDLRNEEGARLPGNAEQRQR